MQFTEFHRSADGENWWVFVALECFGMGMTGLDIFGHAMTRDSLIFAFWFSHYFGLSWFIDDCHVL